MSEEKQNEKDEAGPSKKKKLYTTFSNQWENHADLKKWICKKDD